MFSHILDKVYFPDYAWRALRILASLKLTLAIIIVLVVGIGIIYYSNARYVWAVAIPFTAFAVNLSAAVATNPVFRRQSALLVFHLALITIVLLIALGRLTYLKGKFELVTGETFAGQLLEVESGPWHVRRLEQTRLKNEGFTISYEGPMQRGITKNKVSWAAPDGRSGRSVIGDQYPLLMAGYRFYTTPNKGFATLVSWQAADGSPELTGSVHMPSYPRLQYQQMNEWQPPGSNTKLWLMLLIDEVILASDKPSEFRVPERHELVVRLGSERHSLKPGDSLRLPEGKLTYRGLSSWMGYEVSYDFTLPWLLAASLLAIVCMAWHFWLKFSSRPWDAAVDAGKG